MEGGRARGFNEEKAKKLLDVPGNPRAVSLLTLVYPDEKPRTKHRKPSDGIIHYGKYGVKET